MSQKTGTGGFIGFLLDARPPGPLRTEDFRPLKPAASRARIGVMEHNYDLTVTWTGNRGEGTTCLLYTSDAADE